MASGSGEWRLVAGVVTQGRYNEYNWITKYMVWTSAEGTTWANVTNIDGQEVR